VADPGSPAAAEQPRALSAGWGLAAPVPTLREAVFLLLVGVGLAVAWEPVATVIGRSLRYGRYEHYSYIIALPFFSAYLLFLDRGAILARAGRAIPAGLAIAALGGALLALARVPAAGDAEVRLSVGMAGAAVLWVGAFAAVYGLRAVRVAAFPLALLLFMVPLPPAALDVVVRFLQRWSTEGTEVLFALIGMPYLREGFVFALPTISIEVAEECSGIRSSLALTIVGLVMAHLFLRRAWSRAVLVLAIVPVAIAKNAVRIVLLSWLGVYVDPGFITGSALHSRGGIPFFVASFAILAGLTWLLRRGEGRAARPVPARPA
jgi:exosortase